MSSSPTITPCPASVIVNGMSAPLRTVQRCVERLLPTVPPGTRVTVFTPRSTRLTPVLARRVKGVRGDLHDYLTYVTREAGRDNVLVVVPATSTPSSSDWFEVASARMADQPRLAGVLGPDGGQLFAFPREVTVIDGPQTVWSPLPGLDVWDDQRETRGSRVHRSLSAVLIVKDEEDVLEVCLRAIAPFVDEIVVYDTGSTDRTVDIAREIAHTVIEGHWDGDFGAARNRALVHAKGDWVFSIDADEVAEGDHAALREHIDASTADGSVVEIVSTDHGRGRSGDTTRGMRLFQRVGATWRGALHEQVVFDGGARPARISTDHLPVLLVHSGYSTTTMAEKDKRSRNVEISKVIFEAATPGTIEHSDAAANYGRSLAGAGHIDAAMHVLNVLLTLPASPGNCVQAARIAVPTLLTSSQWELCDLWLALSERSGESTGQVMTWTAGALIGQDRLDEAAGVLDELLAGDRGSADVWGHRFDPDSASTLRAELDLIQGAPDRAAVRVREILHRSPERVNLQVLVNALGATGMTMRDLIEEAPEAFLERALRDMVLLPPQVSLHWFAAHSAARPGDFRPLVAGNAVAARSGWLDALEWSTRAREAGLRGVCAMRDLAQDTTRSALERALCWGFLSEGFGEPDAMANLAQLVAALDDEDGRVVRNSLREQLPDLLLPLHPKANITT